MDTTQPTEAPPRFPGWVVVALAGGLHSGSRHALGVLDAAVSAHPGAHVLVDLSEVTLLDSAPLGAFALARDRAAAAGGLLSLHAPSSHAQMLLQVWSLEPLGPG